ncbi:MAG: MFS transporter [Armatimonadota bacterium]|nr:MFS transporter [Armatimonadota bacterium]MDR7449594.1 MFS transporter [Armatimonadota bacterium]MDR7460222.1 MFS transporter [Armatimonadota bacterium]MDR7480309.1 MFS transporter [Armatimonadota bacterium]MDR7489127.1 MFS transporter [Armatimonadota bacterium]
MERVATADDGRAAALRFVVLLGVVSLLADATYEGARSVVGPYLGTLGATATVVGVVAGLGELLGYALRLLSGRLADRTRRYWAITIVGYTVNLAAVPLLALARGWGAAAALVVAERIGKAIRTPARDAMLSHATQQVGRGWGFGLHEALDQAGAVLGPLLVAGALAAGSAYRGAFALLAAPAALALGVLVAARRLYPRPRDLEVADAAPAAAGLGPRFRRYVVAVALVGAGYADFALIAYHLQRHALVPAPWVPLLYAAAMGTDAAAALALGRWYDRAGTAVLVPTTAVAAAFAPLAFLGGPASVLAGVLLWGLGMGAQESVVRAAVAEMAPPERRAGAYGVLNAVYGIAWFGGSALMGGLYDRSVVALVAFSVAAQLAALPLFVAVSRKPRGSGGSSGRRHGGSVTA